MGKVIVNSYNGADNERCMAVLGTDNAWGRHKMTGIYKCIPFSRTGVIGSKDRFCNCLVVLA